MSPSATLRYEDGTLVLLDQRLLPGRRQELRCATAVDVAEAIRTMAVRGAPAIGVAAAHGVAVAARAAAEAGGDPSVVRRAAEDACAVLETARPTAINLAGAVHRMRRAVMRDAGLPSGADVAEALESEAAALERFEAEACTAMGRHGAELLGDNARVLVHCNAGSLATVGSGTALAPVYEAHARGTLDVVFVDETRPRLQGARLTAYELGEAGIPHLVIVDSLAATLMLHGAVDAVLVGADRIAANGDVANKVGTYSLAVACAHHGLPFYVVAPTTTVDPACETGADIPIEERDPAEVLELGGDLIAPASTRALNPAFDVTPASLVTALVTEHGVASPVTGQTIAGLMRR
ncbi:MAG TPA: S-methyl-5-thioribose-1-phosphate isomerase [Candidatus Dormibacteraeota bacterium]|nr:S-methyl-5-thioribose-1-phosphate isomerase [Candidatus Dormibacteraeota bacterium]